MAADAPRVLISGASVAGPVFGLNEITLATKDAKAANKLVDRLKSNLSKCKNSQLTARVTNVEKVTSVGVKKTKIAGWTAVVTQKSTDGWVRYRVGIVSAGSKVIYTFLNPSADYDFTHSQWEVVAVRAGERATQV
jgi:predicted Zn-dependent protease